MESLVQNAPQNSEEASGQPETPETSPEAQLQLESDQREINWKESVPEKFRNGDEVDYESMTKSYNELEKKLGAIPEKVSDDVINEHFKQANIELDDNNENTKSWKEFVDKHNVSEEMFKEFMPIYQQSIATQQAMTDYEADVQKFADEQKNLMSQDNNWQGEQGDKNHAIVEKFLAALPQEVVDLPLHNSHAGMNILLRMAQDGRPDTAHPETATPTLGSLESQMKAAEQKMHSLDQHSVEYAQAEQEYWKLVEKVADEKEKR